MGIIVVKMSNLEQLRDTGRSLLHTSQSSLEAFLWYRLDFLFPIHLVSSLL